MGRCQIDTIIDVLGELLKQEVVKFTTNEEFRDQCEAQKGKFREQMEQLLSQGKVEAFCQTLEVSDNLQKHLRSLLGNSEGNLITRFKEVKGEVEKCLNKQHSEMSNCCLKDYLKGTASSLCNILVSFN